MGILDTSVWKGFTDQPNDCQMSVVDAFEKRRRPISCAQLPGASNAICWSGNCWPLRKINFSLKANHASLESAVTRGPRSNK